MSRAMRNRGVEVYVGLSAAAPSPTAPYAHQDLLDLVAIAGAPGPALQNAMVQRHAAVVNALYSAAQQPPGARHVHGWVALTMQLLARGVVPSVAVNTAFDHVYMPLVPAAVGALEHAEEPPRDTCLVTPGAWPLALTVSTYTHDAAAAMVLRDVAPLMARLAQHARDASTAQPIEQAAQHALASAAWLAAESLARVAIVAGREAAMEDAMDDAPSSQGLAVMGTQCALDLATVAAAVETYPHPARTPLVTQLCRLVHALAPLGSPVRTLLEGLVELVQRAPHGAALTLDDARDVVAYAAATSVDADVPQEGDATEAVLQWRALALVTSVAGVQAAERGSMLEVAWWRQQHPQVGFGRICGWNQWLESVHDALHVHMTSAKQHLCHTATRTDGGVSPGARRVASGLEHPHHPAGHPHTTRPRAAMAAAPVGRLFDASWLVTAPVVPSRHGHPDVCLAPCSTRTGMHARRRGAPPGGVQGCSRRPGCGAGGAGSPGAAAAVASQWSAALGCRRHAAAGGGSAGDGRARAEVGRHGRTWTRVKFRASSFTPFTPLYSAWPGDEATPAQLQALTALGLPIEADRPLEAAAATIAMLSSNTTLRTALADGLALFDSLLQTPGPEVNAHALHVASTCTHALHAAVASTPPGTAVLLPPAVCTDSIGQTLQLHVLAMQVVNRCCGTPHMATSCTHRTLWLPPSPRHCCLPPHTTPTSHTPQPATSAPRSRGAGVASTPWQLPSSSSGWQPPAMRPTVRCRQTPPPTTQPCTAPRCPTTRLPAGCTRSCTNSCHRQPPPWSPRCLWKPAPPPPSCMQPPRTSPVPRQPPRPPSCAAWPRPYVT